MITIRRYANVAEAGFAKSLLISEGIDAFLADEEAGALGPQFVPWGMRLQVREEDEQRANEILAEKENETKEASVPPTAPAKENPPIKCPGCGAEWALTDEEMALPTFSCPDCGAAIPHETETSALKKPSHFDWHSFLPRSESKWVFILAIVAYAYAMERLWTDIVDPLAGANDYLKHIIGWGPVTWQIFRTVTLTPIWESLVLIGVIEGCRRLRAPVLAQIFVSTAVVVVIDGFKFWPHGVAVLPFFAVSGYAYLYWRPKSWREAIFIVMATHSLSNCFSATWLLCTQINRDRSSYNAIGLPYAWDHADSFFRQGETALHKSEFPDAIDAFRQAIALYPYDERYHAYLAIALTDEDRLSEATDEYHQSINLDETDAWSWVGLASVLSKEKRFPEALDACHRALEVASPYQRPAIQGWIDYIEPRLSGTSQH